MNAPVAATQLHALAAIGRSMLAANVRRRHEAAIAFAEYADMGYLDEVRRADERRDAELRLLCPPPRPAVRPPASEPPAKPASPYQVAARERKVRALLAQLRRLQIDRGEYLSLAELVRGLEAQHAGWWSTVALRAGVRAPSADTIAEVIAAARRGEACVGGVKP